MPPRLKTSSKGKHPLHGTVVLNGKTRRPTKCRFESYQSHLNISPIYGEPVDTIKFPSGLKGELVKVQVFLKICRDENLCEIYRKKESDLMAQIEDQEKKRKKRTFTG